MTKPGDAFNQCHLGTSHPGDIKLRLSGGTGTSKFDSTFGIACDPLSEFFEMFCRCIT